MSGPAQPVLDWLLGSDVAVQFQVTRDLLHRHDAARALQARIATDGYGAALLAARREDGHWGRGFYQPKWTSTHYTLLELKNLGLARDHVAARESVTLILRTLKGLDGGLDPDPGTRPTDVCINGMALGYCSWFGADETLLASVVDCLLAQVMPDGGFNCRSTRSGANHSSVHTTVSVIEGITEYQRGGYRHRLEELLAARDSAVEFLLRHRLFRSERTGEPIHPEMLRLHHPARWHYDVLRALEALAAAGVADDPRLDDGLSVLLDRRRADGRWVANRGWPGETHVPAERAGRPNPWVTLRALRVLAAYPR